jgi:hypothetical protein
MESYWNKYGLINAYKGENVAENCPLFTYEFILIKEQKGEPNKPEREALRSFIEGSKVRPGLYNQSPEPFSGSREDRMSHDQLTTICAFSYKYGYEWHKEVWEEIKRQWLRYDNVGPTDTFKQKFKNTRFLHPRDIIYIGLLAGNPICKLLSPLLMLIMMSSCKSIWKVRPSLDFRIIYAIKKFKFFPKKLVRRMHSTDGKLLTYVRCRSALNIPILAKTYKICSKILKKSDIFKGWNGTFAIYFHSRPDYPINETLKDYSLD